MRLGIFGGTFNPIHLGHLIIAESAAEALQLDRVVFIPCAQPPHKSPRLLATAPHRLRMAKLAIQGNPRFTCSDIEIRRGGPSYSVETMRHLRTAMPKAQFYFIIGSDSLRELHTWREAEALAELCQFISVTRPGEAISRCRLKVKVHRLEGHPVAIASSEIRSRLALGKSVRYLVPDAVRRYIERHRLYR